MKSLTFGDGLMIPSLNGSKRFTIRRFGGDRHSLFKGDVVKGVFADGITILLRITKNTRVMKFKDLLASREHVNENGYYFDDAYFADLRNYYIGLQWDDVGAVIFFEVLKYEGVPVVSLNE